MVDLPTTEIIEPDEIAKNPPKAPKVAKDVTPKASSAIQEPKKKNNRNAGKQRSR